MGLQSSGEFQTSCLKPSVHSRAHQSQCSMCSLHSPWKNSCCPGVYMERSSRSGSLSSLFIPLTTQTSFWKRMLTCRSLCAQGKQRCQGKAEGPFPRAPPCTDTPPTSSLLGVVARPRKLPAPGCPAQHRGTRRCQRARLLPAAGGCILRWCSATW